ncbi:MAG TPA: outer membrane beta-barrel protein, partial [Alphaproteobacteria bacterium]|nr:outer membrane beta-barrel protein [Alphaproteobacteria bacterium]
MKKILSLLTLGTAFACAYSSPFSGLHLGVQGGMGIMGGSASTFENTNNNTASGDFTSGKGGIFGIEGLAGYVFSNNLYTGFGLAASLSNVNARTNSLDIGHRVARVSTETKIKLKNLLQAYARVGVVVGQFLPFLELGYTSGAFKADSSIPQGDTFGSFNKRLNGMSFGFGVATALSDKLVAEAKITHTTFKKKTFDLKDNVTGAVEGNTTLKPKLTTFMVSLRYKIATF